MSECGPLAALLNGHSNLRRAFGNFLQGRQRDVDPWSFSQLPSFLGLLLSFFGCFVFFGVLRTECPGTEYSVSCPDSQALSTGPVLVTTMGQGKEHLQLHLQCRHGSALLHCCTAALQAAEVQPSPRPHARRREFLIVFVRWRARRRFRSESF